MTGNEALELVRSMRRQFLLSSVTRTVLLAVISAGFIGSLWTAGARGGADLLWSAASMAAIAWALLTLISVRQARTTNHASAYIASGRLDLAEAQLKDALRQFSLYRGGKLLACHNLAVVTHGQKRYRAAAVLCDGLIALAGRTSSSASRTCRILLADCSLFLGDPSAASGAIAPLSERARELGLAEQLQLLPVELRCQVARRDFAAAADSLSWKVQRAEMLDSPRAALSHALLAAACRKTGKPQAAAFLQRRAELYHDLRELAQEDDILRDSGRGGATADNN